jgi:hypothetical protein
MFFDFSAVKKSKESLEKRLFDIRNQTLELQKKVEAIRYAPAAREDAKNHVRTWMRDAANGYAQTLLEKTTRFAKSPANSNGHDLRAFVTFGGATSAKGQLVSQDLQPTTQEIGQAMCALLGPVLLDSLIQSIDAMPWPENAVPIASREQLVDDLNKQISKLITEEAQIVRQAGEAGLTVD